jgi:predicted metal-dependent enzyme (double-stranded beta helix superfamily)
MFNLQQFIETCRKALTEKEPSQRIKALVEEAIANPDEIRDAFLNAEGMERQGPISFACRDADLTIADVTTPPGLRSPAHNHNMWAVIGVYEGQEHNRFYRYQNGDLHEHGERLLEQGELVGLEPETIHAIFNPIPTPSSAIHVYGGDLVERQNRSMWNPHSLKEEPYDISRLIEYVREISEPI